ncbi:hypothetical protein BDV97DRAFT_415136 [Delphinella strobiligena]|nr:hypothetical protein BDV97DRAFT_415136 [Delphinella strobiligena]
MAGYTVTTFFTMSSLILSFLDTVIDTVILMVRGLLHSIPLALCLSTCYCTWRYGIVSVHDGVVFWTLTIWEDLAVILCYWAAWWYIVFFVTIDVRWLKAGLGFGISSRDTFSSHSCATRTMSGSFTREKVNLIDELLSVQQYARSQLFPNGVIPRDPYNAGDTHAQWTAFSLERNFRDPNRHSSYYYFWYLNFFQNRVNTVLDALHALTGQAPTTQRFKTLTHLFIFIGNRPDNGMNSAPRYRYLCTLSGEEITRIDSLLDEIALAIATRYRDTPPPESSAYSKLYHNGDNLRATVYDCIQILPPALHWPAFTRSGAYESCLKSWLLGLSTLSFYHFFVLDESRRTGHPMPFYEPVWKKGMGAKENPAVPAARLEPNLAHDASLELFVTMNPLHMWREVMRKVGAEGLLRDVDIEGQDTESGEAGERVAWSVPLERNLHPEWDVPGRRDPRRQSFTPPVRLSRWAGSVLHL